MRRILLAGVAALSLAGCTTIGTITGSSVSPQSASVAVNSFDALETVATAYLQLPACGSSAAVICRNAAAAAKIVPAVRSARTARDQIVAALNASGGAAIPIVSYNTLAAAVTTLQSVYAQYNVQTPTN